MSEQHWKEQAKIYKDELLKAQKLFSNMHKSAIEAWDSLDLKDQSDLDCAREWFFEGFAHGNTAQAKTLTDEEIKDFIYPQFVFEDGGIGMPLDEFLATVRAILRKAQEK
jgi:hypothetical protein